MVQTSIRTNVIAELAIAVVLILSPLLLTPVPSKGKASRIAASVLLVISAAVLMFVALMSDAILGISESWIFTLIIWAAGIGVCLAVRVRYRSVLSLIIACLVTTFVLFLHFMDLLPVKPYKRFFAAIQTGMNEQQVLALLSREFPAGGRLNVPVRRDFAQNEMDFFLDPTESAWNAECIRIHLSDGRVVSKEYSRD
jgi:predicted membrane protein